MIKSVREFNVIAHMERVDVILGGTTGVVVIRSMYTSLQ